MIDKITKNKWISLIFWAVLSSVLLFLSRYTAYIYKFIDGIVSIDSNFLVLLSNLTVFCVFFVCLYFITKRYTSKTLTFQYIGLDLEPKFTDIGLGIVGAIAAKILGVVLILIAAILIPSFDANQAQNIGANNFNAPVYTILAFINIVIIAPLFEESIFRGFLYRKFREKSGFWVSAIAVSLLFGIAHGQPNVGIMTFAMSMIMCAFREYLSDNNTIWSSIMIHFFNNLFAFVIIFVLPNFYILNGVGR